MSIPAAGARTSHAESGGCAGGQEGAFSALVGTTSPMGWGGGQDCCEGDSPLHGRWREALTVPPAAWTGSASPVLPHPHLPLPAHCGEEGVQWCGERVSLRGHGLGAGGRLWPLHEGEAAQTAQMNVPATTLSHGSSVAGDSHP